MTPELPTLDEAFGEAQDSAHYPARAGGALPTVDEAFSAAEPSFIATMDRRLQSSVFRVLDAFAVGGRRGFQEGFGDEPIATPATVFSNETDDFLKSIGVFNDYAKGRANVLSAMFEGVIKGSAAGLAVAMRAGEAILSAPLEAIGEAGEEIGLARPGELTGQGGLRGALTDPGAMMALGPFGEYTALTAQANARRAANLHVDLSRARASGVIGEGEAGFFDAVPLTPENAQARVAAAQEAGIPTPAPPAAPPDVHVLARRIDQPTFEKYDALNDTKNTLRQNLQALAADRENLPEAVQAREEINTILGKVHGVEERLTKKARERLAAAEARLDAVLSQDTPEMARARKALLEADIAQRDLVPQVSTAYRQAHEMMPSEPPAAATIEAASTGKPAPTKPEATAEAPPIGAVAEGPQIETVTGERVSPPRQRTTTELRAVPGTGPVQTRTLSEGVEAKAIETQLVDDFGDLPEYHQVSMADQAARAAEYIATDAEGAKAVAMGLKAPPRGVLPESVFVAVEKKAIAEGDVELLRQLATESKLTTAATTMGQRIRTLGERDATSPVGAIQAVQSARRQALDTRNAAAIKDTVKEIKAAVRRSAPNRDAWVSFIESIQCAE